MSRTISLISALALAALVPAAPTAEDESVVWTNLVHATADGSVLEKTSGCDGCDDAGATSLQVLSSGDGYIEFTVGETGTFWLAGLSHGNDGTSYADIDFAFRFNGAGYADILENGVYQPGGDTTYAPGDVFRVAVVSGRVQYSKNGRFIRESAGTPEYPMLLDVSLGSVSATVRDAKLGVFPPPPSGGGFFEKAGSPALRPRLTAEQIAAFLPALGAKGRFTFPAPYNTEAVRLTDATDCVDGRDCLWYLGYSNWRNINNHVAGAEMLIFVGTDPARGGRGPTLIRYDKTTDTVVSTTPLFPSNNSYSYTTGEGWYFSGTQPHSLYTFRIGSTELRRFDVITRQFEATPAMDLTGCPRPDVCPADASYIAQPHSSDNDRMHSASVQNTDWRRVGCVVYDAALDRWRYFPAPPGFFLDECHVDKFGGWLLIHETRADGSRQNRIADLQTGIITTIDVANGALGHLDMGFGYAVGADTNNPLANATILLKFPVGSVERPVGPVVHFNKRWDMAAANHIAHGNARPGLPAESQYACGSNAGRVADMADEIVCFSLDPNRNSDGSIDVLVVAPVMTDLDAAGGGDLDGDDYEQLPKGNIDVTGRYFIWTTNTGGNRLDAFLVKIPDRFGPP